jgi:hypothetical protein
MLHNFSFNPIQSSIRTKLVQGMSLLLVTSRG